jgi:hypothetical protein
MEWPGRLRAINWLMSFYAGYLTTCIQFRIR